MLNTDTAALATELRTLYPALADLDDAALGAVLLLAPHLPFEFIRVFHEPDGSFPNGIPNPLLPGNRQATADAVTKLARTKGRDAAVAVLNEFGAAKLPDVKPEQFAAIIAACEKALRDAHLPQNIVVDCSHGNSGKKPERQGPVLFDVLAQIEAGNRSIRGFMLESNLEWGAQPLGADPAKLNPRQSVTDACIDWPATEALLREAHARIRKLIRQESK